jgi:tetratricopeptide (TPR) repeat protein
MVPTDVYYIRCEYARWNKEGSWTVNRGNNEVCVFDPQLGDLSLTSSDLPATYQVTDQKGRLMEQGDLPATVTGLPSGLYEVSVQHSGHRLNRNVFVAQDQVNPLAVKFAFGAVRLESQPAGAAVYAGGNYLGATPLVVRELDPGPVTFQIQARGYADAGVSAFVLADETITAGTNLLSLNYVQAMQSARNNLAAGDYHGAVTALEQALAAKPDDTEALQLQPIARGHEYIQTAAELAAQDDFIGAGEKLKPALALLPDDAEAKKLQAEYLKHVPEQVARMKEEQTHKAFRMVCEASPGSRYFDSNQIKCGARTPEEMRDAILRTFNSEMPTFKVVQNMTVTDGLYELQMLQGAEIPLSTMRRQLLMVIGTGGDGRTVVCYKVNEYQKKAALTVNITLNSIDTGERPEDWIPVHPSRIRMTPILSNQIATGVHMADRLIRLAAGLTPAE